MTDNDAATLRLLWSRYERLLKQLDQARWELDQAIEDTLAAGELRQADIARVLGCTRQDVNESLRRQARRRERGEIE
jgi:predicted XRE-type DNA-binding protein